MCTLLKLGALLHVVILITTGTADEDCDNSGEGYSLPCNPAADPWEETRAKMDRVTTELDINESAERGISKWMRVKFGKEKVEAAVNTPFKLAKIGKEVRESLKSTARKLTEAAALKALTPEMAKSTAKGLKKVALKAVKILGALASAAQFIGPIIDIIMLFKPITKSRELKAIESGFAKVGAKIDSVSYQLENIKDAEGWNSIVSVLLEFEGNVDHAMEKYKQLVEDIQAMDPSQDMPLIVKSHIEELIDAVRGSADIGNKLQIVDNIFKGDSAFTNGKTLIEMFVDFTDNDCSKILPMSNKLIKIVKDAQRLQYFYEINQKLVQPDDDKAYPKMIYDMYKESVTQYTKCTQNAASYALKEVKVLYNNDEKLVNIIDKIEPKYDLYNWAAMKENDIEEEDLVLIDNSARKMDVTLTGLSEDDQEKQRLSLFVLKMPAQAEVADAVGRIQTILVNLKDSDLPEFGPSEDWDDTQKFRRETLADVQNLLKKDPTLKSLIDLQKVTMVMFKNDSSIELHGWHYKSNMEVRQYTMRHNKHGQKYKVYDEDYLGFTVGFLFNFPDDNSDFTCINGHRIDMSFDGNFAYCLCNMDYGGEACDIQLKNDPQSSLSDSVMNLVKIYKVPGMFDLQDEIKKSTDTVMQEIEDSKQEVFAAIRQTGTQITKSKNAILSAQSIMLNDLKADNARLLKEFSGLGEAMEAAFEKERNDRIYRTEKGQKVIIKTIGDANKKVTDSINKLTGRVIENRYFKELKLHIPVYQEKFETAIEYGGYGERSFSEYLSDHAQDFQVSKASVKNAIVQKSDSFVMARMQISMSNGCTETYTQQIGATWAELMELHLAMNTMEMWDLDYKIRTSEDQDKINFHKHEKEELQEKAAEDTNEFKTVYRTRSCPAFSLPDMLGGGCTSSVTYPGQSVPMQCSDPNKSLVLLSTGEVISEVLCQRDSSWAVNVNNLACVYKCLDSFYNKYYDIGEKRTLFAAPSGSYFADANGHAVTESTCLAPTPQQDWKAPPSIGRHSIFLNVRETPLQIKTDSTTGSGDMVDVSFVDMVIYAAGGLTLYFTNPMQYRLHRCMETKSTLNYVPVETDKVWTIFRLDNSVKIKCNGVLLVDVQMSSCTHHESWVYDTRDTDKIIFNADDTATDYYRPIGDCVEDNDTSGSNYRGYTAATISGRQCQRWDSLLPNIHGRTPSNYPRGGLTGNNYCRNPDGEPRLWCYSNEGTTPRMEDCELPTCSDSGSGEQLELRSASQSTTVWSGDANRAIDGNTDGAYSKNSCSHTDAAPESWWMASLAEVSAVNKVVIYNRKDCCSNRIDGAKVYVGEVLCGAVVYRAGKTVYEVECGGAVGGGVKIVQNNHPLTICELVVQGPKVLRGVWSRTMKMDIKECAKFDFCGFGGTCTETESLFMCTCPEGYTVGSDGKCKDENECSFGMVGYNKCLLRSQLGSCKNTVGSYMCECLEGSYTNANLVGKECMACNCNEHGLQSCDGTTGACLCRANVAGADCGVCKTGHTGYPFCEYCEPGYYKDGSNCVKCSCEETGVTDSICSSRSGQCTCKENMAGSRCDHCKAHYINFPACTPDVKDGTLTPWGAWSSWSAGECGQSEKSKLGSGYTQTRTRKRRCDNDTKNIHGRSCTGDITLETESRWHNVCRDVRRLWITIPDVTDAGTTAYLWMKIRQAGVTSKYIQCETWALWDDPDNDDLDDDIVYGPNGCNIAFDITKPLEISLQSDSSNDVYVNKIGVTIGNIRKGYYSYPKKYEVLDEDTNNIYFTTSNDKDTDITKEKCYGC